MKNELVFFILMTPLVAWFSSNLLRGKIKADPMVDQKSNVFGLIMVLAFWSLYFIL